MVRRCWVNFQCKGVLLTWLTVGQGPIVLSVGAGGGCLDIFSLICHFSILSPSLWETARYRLKYCLKGPLSPKQPTNQPIQYILPWPIGHIGSKTRPLGQSKTTVLSRGHSFDPSFKKLCQSVYLYKI